MRAQSLLKIIKIATKCPVMRSNKMLASYNKKDISAKFPLENIVNLHLYENCFSNVVFDEISMNFVPTKLVLL